MVRMGDLKQSLQIGIQLWIITNPGQNRGQASHRGSIVVINGLLVVFARGRDRAGSRPYRESEDSSWHCLTAAFFLIERTSELSRRKFTGPTSGSTSESTSESWVSICPLMTGTVRNNHSPGVPFSNLANLGSPAGNCKTPASGQD